MIEIQNGDGALYTSHKDEDGEQNVAKVYTPADPVEYNLRNVPKGSTTLYSPQSIIPQKIIIRPEITEPTETESVRINAEKLYNAYGSGAAQIIKDVQNKQPLDPDVAEHLITSRIITESKDVTYNTKMPLPKVPLKKVSKTSVKAYSESMINNITNFIYKLIYSKNG